MHSIEQARVSGAYQQVSAALTRFFSSADALSAAFWATGIQVRAPGATCGALPHHVPCTTPQADAFLCPCCGLCVCTQQRRRMLAAPAYVQGDGTTGNTAAALSFPFMHTFYAAVSTLTPPIKDSIMRAVDQLLALLGQLPGDANPGVARQVAILIANPMLDEVEYSRCGGSG